MKVFVFGATGFLGCALVRKLIVNGYSVSVLTRDPLHARALFDQNVTIHVGDIIGGCYPNLSHYDSVINCAGEIICESKMRCLHVDGVRDALQSLPATHNTHWIQISSVGVYGPQQSGIIREDHPFNPLGEYEVTKADGDLLISKTCRLKNVPFTIIRPSNIFGNNMPNQSLARLIRMINRRLFFFIGDPDKHMMNYVHVGDVVDAIVACINNKNAINNDFIISDVIDQRSFVQLVKCEIGGGWTPSLPEPVIRNIISVAKHISNFPLTQGRLNALTSKVVYSTDKARNYLDLSMGVGIKEGLRQYCRHLKVGGFQ